MIEFRSRSACKGTNTKSRNTRYPIPAVYVVAKIPGRHCLAAWKVVVVINLKIDSKTSAMKTANEFEYAGEIYEVMNISRQQPITSN